MRNIYAYIVSHKYRVVNPKFVNFLKKMSVQKGGNPPFIFLQVLIRTL